MFKTIDRLMKFITYAGLSARQFDLSIGAANGYTLRMRKNNASIGSDVIENILKVYPQLSVEWLITGEGEMLKEKKEFSLDFEKLSPNRQLEIENIIEQKIKAKHQIELKQLLKEVTEEISKKQKNNK
tara:strand:+ start:478 stop:861 length:384 start_codon:yes stop_codon:yes gene_type:complete